MSSIAHAPTRRHAAARPIVPAATWPAWTDAHRYELGPAGPTARALAARHAVGAVAETTTGCLYIDAAGIAYFQPHPSGRQEDDLPDRVRVAEMVWDFGAGRWIAEPRGEGRGLDMGAWALVEAVARDWASNL